jgi:hypothetical protein
VIRPSIFLKKGLPPAKYTRLDERESWKSLVVLHSIKYSVIVSPPLSDGEPKITRNSVADITSRVTPVGAPGITIGAFDSGAIPGRE